MPRTKPPPTVPAGPQTVLLRDGRLHPVTRPALRADDRGLLLGLGLFETVRVVGGHAPLWPNHRARLAAGLAQLGIPWPTAVDISVQRLPELAKRIGLHGLEACLRVTVTAGSPHGSPVVLAQLSALPGRVFARRQGSHLISRGHPRALAHLKSLAWLASAAALRDLPLDTEPLILDGETCLETASANLFVVRAGSVRTPPADGRILAGIARARAMSICAALGLTVREATLTRADLLGAEAVWITNALLPVVPVLSLDGHALATTALHRAVAERYDLTATLDEERP